MARQHPGGERSRAPTADGRKLLITHGDAFDVITRYHRWLALAGDAAYKATMQAGLWLNRARSAAGLPYWSLAAFAKQHVKTAVNIVSDFEASVARECRRRKFAGVVCGHIHQPEIRRMHGITYYNCGDWVEACTALAECADGRIELLRAVPLEKLNAPPQLGPLPLAATA